jgi:hypothetical protein
MRKTGLCGVVIATLFGTAGLLQHPSHQNHSAQPVRQVSTSTLAQAGVNLLNSYSIVVAHQATSSATLLPDGFLRVLRNPGPTPEQLAARRREIQARARLFEKGVAAEQAAARANAEAQAQAEATAQANAEAQAEAAAAAAARAQSTTTTTTTPTSSSAPAGGVWVELRDCESGGNYAEDTGNGYYGAYQFALATWEGLGFSGLPSSASPAVQDEAAQELQARYGWDQWPACAAELGL